VTAQLTMVCEAPADFETAAGLADRIVCDCVDWISSNVIDFYRQWRGWQEDAHYILWREVPVLARRLHVQPRGHFAGRPGDLDAFAARRALTLLLIAEARPSAAFLIRDSDGLLDRQLGLEQARATIGDERLRVVIGVAHTKRECWVLAGFVPRDDAERTRLAALRSELGFEPTTNSERLTAKHEQDKKSAKRVLRLLVDNDRNRERECMMQTELSILRENGSGCGLTSFLSEVQSKLVPIFGVKN
jgi:hypothetical protein